jgi:tRNA (mo5U34)-methyltransferase
MDLAAAQRQIDAIEWYHEFDFGNGLRTKSAVAGGHGHRYIWEFIRRHLDTIDFRGKSVLDIGAWDGYWSFEAEKRGARRVLATDDVSQNYMAGTGIHLAKELLNSRIDVRQDLSVYKLDTLGEKFDVVLFLGVYYHLHEPFHALAQIRHCCHPGTVVVIDGPVTEGLAPGEALYNFADHSAEWLPTVGALQQLVRGTYFTETRHELMAGGTAGVAPAGRLGWRYRLGMVWDALRGSRAGIRERANRIAPPPVPPRANVRRLVMTCKPFEGVEDLHIYPPPIGLHMYDPRFRGIAAAA